jgi:hypothetical protein
MLYSVFSVRGRRAALVTLFCGIFAALTSFSAFAANLTLAWDPSTDPTVVGYDVYYGGASGVYTNMIDVGTNTTVTISNLVPGATYYFAATTYTATGLQSTYSSEIVYTVPVLTTNQPPTINQPANVSIPENAGPQVVNLTGITSGATNEIQVLTVTASSGNTGLIPNPTVSYTSPSTTGTLVFTPLTNNFGSTTITVTVNDGGASNNITTRTFTVTVAPVNNPPTLNSIGNLSIPENAGPQTVNLTGITSGATNESQTLTVTASSSNTGLIPNPTVSYTSPNTTGSLTVTPVSNNFGSTTITVTVNDGGASNNITTRTFAVTVNPVNNPPTLNAITDLSIPENAGPQIVNLSGISSGATNESQTLTVTASSSNTGLIPNPTVSYTSPSATGTLTLSPLTNGFGSATITVTVNDGGASNNIATRTFNVTVNPVNQPPTLNAIGNLSLPENATQQTVNLSGITSGATNEAQTLTVTVSSSNTGLIPTPTVSYTSPNTTGTLTFTPTPNNFGSSSITVTVNDGGASNNITTRTFTVSVNAGNQQPTLDQPANVSIPENAGAQVVNLTGITSGATNEIQTLTITASSSNTGLIPNPTVSYTSPNTTGSLTVTPAVNGFGSSTITVTVNDGGASNNITTRTFTVTVNQVNQLPTLNAIANLSIPENAAPQTVNLSGITSGATNEVQTLTVTASSSNPGLVPNPSVTYTSPNSTGILTVTPVATAFGSATITVTVNDGGASNNIATRSFTVTVNPVNTQPTLDPLAGLNIGENAGPQVVNLTGITSGATNENQTLTVSASSSNTGLIPNPTVSYTSPNATGTLTLTPTTNNIGSSTVTVTVNDGGASNNIITRTFTVTVNGVNQAPTINVIADRSIPENGGPQTVNLSGITSGATNEIQTLTVTASSSNTGLIPNPSVTYTSPNTTGTLSFSPAPNQFGSATVTVTVNDGGASNNITTRTFNVTVNPVNQQPTLNPLGNLTLIENDGQQTVNLSGISSGAANENQTLLVSASSSNPGVIPTPSVSYTSPNTTGSLSFTPANNGFGSATITVTVNDGGTSNNIVTRSFTVVVDAPPTISALTNYVLAAGNSTPAFPFTIGDADTSVANLTLTATSDNPALAPTNTIIFGGSGSNRTITVSPLVGQTGIVNIAVFVSDGITSNSSSFQLNVQTPPQPPTNLHVVTVQGLGSLSPDLAGQTLAIGSTYTVTAIPAAGQTFTGWSGSITSTESTITFVVTSNLTLQANFSPTNFTAAQATYSGLFYEVNTNGSDLVRQSSSGAFNLTATKKGRYSGYVLIGKNRYPFSGNLNAKGQDTKSLSRHGADTLSLEVHLGLGGQANQAFGSVANGSWSAGVVASRAVFNSRTNPAPFAGNYTVILPGHQDDPSVPAGDGYGSVRVSSSGIVSLAGNLADGTRFTRSAPISQQGEFPVYAALYSGGGSVLSWLTFTNTITNDINGWLNWIKPAVSTSKYYPTGFTTNCLAVGSAYLHTWGGDLMLDLNSANLNVDTGGDITTGFTNSFVLNAASVQNQSPNRLGMSIAGGTGVFHGTVADPTSGAIHTFGGAAFQKSNKAYGALLGTDKSSRIVISN